MFKRISKLLRFTMDKKDYFGATATQYEQFRPRYSSRMIEDIFKVMS